MNINKKQLSTSNTYALPKQVKDLLIVGAMSVLMMIIDKLNNVETESSSIVDFKPEPAVQNSQLALSLLLTGSALVFKKQMLLMLVVLITPTDAADIISGSTDEDFELANPQLPQTENQNSKINNIQELHTAIANNNKDTVIRLIKEGTNINGQLDNGRTALFKACVNDNISIVKLLIEHGADLNLADVHGLTPLNKAIHQGVLEIVEVLAKAGANVDQAAINGMTPLYTSSEEGHLDAVNLLIKQGADLNLADKEGATPVFVAAKNGFTDIVKLLANAGAKLDQADIKGKTPLYAAAGKGHLEIVKLLIEHGADVNLVDKKWLTPVFVAAKKGFTEIIEILAKAGANLDQATTSGMTPLLFSSHQGHIDAVKLLIKHGADLNLAYEDGTTPLTWALNKNNKELIRLLISQGADITKEQLKNEAIKEIIAELHSEYEKISGTATKKLIHFAKTNNIYLMKRAIEMGADVNHIDQSTGESVLHTLSYNGYTNALKLVIENGGDINKERHDGFTPLHFATDQEHFNTVKVIVEAGVNPNIVDRHGRTPLLLAVSSNNLKTVQALIDGCAELDLGAKGNTPLYLAAKQGFTKIVKVLANAGADPNLADDRGLTPLILASYYNHLDVIKLLIDNGADTDLTDKNGDTPVTNAAFNGHLETLKLLIDNGADINLANKKRVTPVLDAAFEGHLETLKLLIEHGADLNLANKNGATPLYNSCEQGHLDAVNLLIKHGADLNLATINGATPVLRATSKGFTKIVKVLANAGADLNLAYGDVITPLFISSRNNDIDSCIILINEGANPNLLDHDNQKASHVTTNKKLKIILEIAEELYPTTLRLDIEKVKNEDYVLEILSELIEKEPSKCIGFIEKFKIDPNNVLDKAVQANNYELVEYLLEKGADIDSVINNIESKPEIDIEILNKLNKIKECGISVIKMLRKLDSALDALPNTEDAISINMEVERIIDELQARSKKETLVVEELSFMSLITDYRVTAMLISTVILMASTFWYLYTQLSQAKTNALNEVERSKQESQKTLESVKRELTESQEVRNRMKDQNDELKKLAKRDQKSLKSESEKAREAEKNIEALKKKLSGLEKTFNAVQTKLEEEKESRSKLENTNTQLSVQITALQEEIAGFKSMRENIEQFHQDIEYVKTASSQKKSEKLTRLINEFDCAVGKFYCPFSLGFMFNPVIANDGLVYQSSENLIGNLSSTGAQITSFEPLECHHEDVGAEIKGLLESIKLIIQSDKKIQTDFERLNPIAGYEKVLSDYKNLLESRNISMIEKLEVFYGLAFIATQAAERSKDLLAAGSIDHTAARHVRNFIQHPPSFELSTNHRTLSNIIDALLALPTSADKESIYQSIQGDIGSLLPETKQSKTDQLKEIIRQAKELITTHEESHPHAGGGAKFSGGEGAAAHGGTYFSSSSSNSSDCVTITPQSMALQGVYIQLANLIHSPELKANKYVKSLKRSSVFFERALRNASAHGQQALTDEEIEIFKNVISALEL